MRSGLARAAAVVNTLAAMPTRAGHITGKAAENISEAEACRLASRAARMQFSARDASGNPRSMGLAQIIQKSRQRRRGAQTHTHKR